MTVTMDASDETDDALPASPPEGEADAGGDDDGGDDGDDGRGFLAERGITLREVVLAALALAGLVGTLVFGFFWNDERTEDAAQASMKNAAGDFLVALFDFDGRTIDEDFDNILSYATGTFEDQAVEQFSDEETRRALREYQASSRVEVRDLFVQSFNGNRGLVFAVVDQTIANNQNPTPRSDQLRVELTMKKVDGEWKVSQLDVLAAPAQTAAAAAGVIPGGSPTTTSTPPTPTTAAP